MISIKEWKWEKVKTKDRREQTLCCPYCNVKVRACSETRIFDAETGAIKYHIYKCPECYMPITIGLDGKVIPQSQFLPFDDVHYLPEKIEKMYCECRKSYANECFYSVMMVARSIIMHVAANLGAEPNLKFIEYIDYLEHEGYISRHNRPWIDKIRRLGNHFIHELDEATEEEAKIAIFLTKHLLINVYELPAMVR